MPDEIRVDEDRIIIDVHSYGMVSKEDIAESIAKIRQIIDETRINKILVDTTKQEAMPCTIDIFELFSTLPREFKVALLVEQTQATARDIRFVETVCINRNTLTKIFQEEEQAVQWLNNA